MVNFYRSVLFQKFFPRSSNNGWGISLFFAAPFALLALVYVTTKSQNAPWLDDWYPSAVIAIKTAEGTIRLGDYFYQHNEHRIVFTNLTTSALTLLCHWDQRKETLISWIIACGSFLVLVVHLDSLKLARPWAVTLCAALFFSLSQEDNWIWGFQTQWHYMVFFAYLTLNLSCRKAGGAVTGMLLGLGCGAALFSFGAGLFVLPACILVAGLKRSLSWKGWVSWVLVEAFLLTAFFYHYRFNTHYAYVTHAALAVGWLDRMLYFLSFLGSPFSPFPSIGVNLSRSVGAVGLFWLVAQSFRNLQNPYLRTRSAFFYGLIALSLLTAAASAHSRAGFGPQEALMGKGTTLANQLWLGLIGLTLVDLVTPETSPGPRWPNALLKWARIFFLTTGLPILCFSTWAQLRKPPRFTQAQIEALQRFPITRSLEGLAVFHPEVGYAGKDHSSFAAITDRLSLHRLSAFGGCDPNLVATSVPFVHELGSQDNPYVSMALWAEAHDNPSEALSYFKKAISYQPGLGMAEIRLGEFFMRQGDCASALAIFNKLLSIQPDNTYVLNKRGEAYELLGDPVAGRKSFSRVLEVDPDNQFAKLKLGLLPQPKKP